MSERQPGDESPGLKGHLLIGCRIEKDASGHERCPLCYKGDITSLLGFLRNRETVPPSPPKSKPKDASRHIYGPWKPVRTPCTNPILPPFDGNGVPWD